MLLYSSTPLQTWIREKEETKTLLKPSLEKKNPTNEMSKNQVILFCLQSIFAAIVLYATISKIFIDFNMECLKLDIVIWSRVFFSFLEFGMIHVLYHKCESNGKLLCLISVMVAHATFFGAGVAFALQCPLSLTHDSFSKTIASSLYVALHYGYICIDFCFVVVLTSGAIARYFKVDARWRSLLGFSHGPENAGSKADNGVDP